MKRFNIIISGIVKSVILVAASLLLMTSCNHDRNHPGWVYMPDMMYSEAYDAYTENPVFSDSLTMQAPVEGTIARGIMPYPYERTADGQADAGKELLNPLEVSPEIIATGKVQYDIFCANCHGYEGKGDGHLYSSGLFTAKPTSLVDEYVMSKPDGEIFHVITKGSISGLMGAHGPQIKPENRWKIVHYIKNELPEK
jgi:mono/diheme cytochrome c family protein